MWDLLRDCQLAFRAVSTTRCACVMQAWRCCPHGRDLILKAWQESHIKACRKNCSIVNICQHSQKQCAKSVDSPVVNNMKWDSIATCFDSWRADFVCSWTMHVLYRWDFKSNDWYWQLQYLSFLSTTWHISNLSSPSSHETNCSRPRIVYTPRQCIELSWGLCGDPYQRLMVFFSIAWPSKPLQDTLRPFGRWPALGLTIL